MYVDYSNDTTIIGVMICFIIDKQRRKQSTRNLILKKFQSFTSNIRVQIPKTTEEYNICFVFTHSMTVFLSLYSVGLQLVAKTFQVIFTDSPSSFYCWHSGFLCQPVCRSKKIASTIMELTA